MSETNFKAFISDEIDFAHRVQSLLLELDFLVKGVKSIRGFKNFIINLMNCLHIPVYEIHELKFYFM